MFCVVRSVLICFHGSLLHLIRRFVIVASRQELRDSVLCLNRQTRLGISIHTNPTKSSHENKVGVHLQLGFLPKKQVSNSPCLLHETIFQT